MKIGAFQAGSKLTDHDGEQVAHMLFGDGVGYSALTATHPPLLERIRRIDPRFDPQMLARLADAEHRLDGVDDEHDPPTASAMIAGLADAPASAPRPARAAAVNREVTAPTPRAVINQIANPALAHVEYATALRRSLPPILVTAAHMREHAIDVVMALLAAREGDNRANLRTIGERLGESRRLGVESLLEIARTLHPAQRLPLAQLAMSALKRRPPTELRLVVDTIDELIRSDGQIDLFEYVLARLIRQQLDETLEPGRASHGSVKLPTLRSEAVGLLGVLARHGHDDADVSRRAFAAGAEVLFPGTAIGFPQLPDWMATLDQALPALNALLPSAKETLILALATTVGHDQRIAIAEAELLRLTCSVLHCPLPPILEPG
jgi:hypothetical protein